MRHRWRFIVAGAAFALLFSLITGLPAGADHPAANHENMEIDFFSPNSTGAVNSDLAFWDETAFAGNYNGFRIFDVSTTPPTLVTNYHCPGPQGDVSVWDRDGDGQADILFLSVDSVMENSACGSPPASPPWDGDDWEGIRVFDISNPLVPVQIDALYQDCGSHTHTLVPDPEDDRVVLYNASYSLRPGPTCGPVDGPPNGRDPLHGVIQVSEVAWDGSDPLNSTGVTVMEITEAPINYPGDPDNRFVAQENGLVGPFDPLRACHDIAVFMPKNLVAAACAEQAQLWRMDPDTLIPDTANPVWVYDDQEDLNGGTGNRNDPEIAVDFWHSATFSWDGKIVNFSDESFAGFAPAPKTCPPVSRRLDAATLAETGTADTGRTHFFNLAGERLSHFMVSRPEEEGYCSTHQGNSILTPGRNLLVQAWYQGGVGILDYTAPRNPKEIAYFDFEPSGAAGSDNWAHYWYENDPQPGTAVTTYGQDGRPGGRGFEVFSATVGIGKRIGLDHLNPQTQEIMIK